MQYSPKLKKAMERLKEIIKEEDVAATIIIHEPGAIEYYQNLNPSYSCIDIDDALGIAVIKGQAIHHNNDKVVAKQKVTDTCNMLHMMSDASVNLTMGLMGMSEMADNTYNVEYTKGGNSSHTTQNN